MALCGEYWCGSQALADGLVPHLTHLSLSGCPHLCAVPEDGTSTEAAMEQLARTEMRQLNKLDLSHNPTLSASTLSRILTHHGAELAELDLIGCTELTAATLLEIATHCTENLTCLKFAHAPPSRTIAAAPDPNEEQQAITMLCDSVTALVCTAFVLGLCSDYPHWIEWCNSFACRCKSAELVCAR